MARISVQTILKTTDNIGQNFVNNTWHFDVDEDFTTNNDLDTQTAFIFDALEDFYEDISGVLANLATTGHRFKAVDVESPAPQFPYLERVWDFGTAINQAALPHEVCVVGSFEADRESGVNQASRRGRVFLGPISLSQSDNDGRLKLTAQTTIAQAFTTLKGKEDTSGEGGWTWIIWSKTRQDFGRVTSGHVDNAFDTQRRRGIQSTLRSTWGDDSTPQG
uniref:Uncharacterized protein n=1 Tax=uncultured prokaryote TaxID=198431 RepID=A0A0H5Q8H0_9ZZZZ|nr:hypothetical protein [uncultured prokaryote]